MQLSARVVTCTRPRIRARVQITVITIADVTMAAWVAFLAGGGSGTQPAAQSAPGSPR